MAFLSGIYVILSLKPLNQTNTTKENMTDESSDDSSNNNTDCPDMLVQRGNSLLLYNSNKQIDDTNPIPFFNLDEYINYLEIQKKKGIVCPVLYLIMEYNAQGEETYRIRPSPFDLQAGLPMATHAFPVSLTGERIPPIQINIQQPQPEKKVPLPPLQPMPAPLQPTQLTPNQMQIIKTIDASRENSPYNANNYPSFDPQGLYVGTYTDLDNIHDLTKQNPLSDNPMDPNWGGPDYTNQMIESGKYNDNNVTIPLLYQPKTAYYPISQYGVPPPVDII
jgi:hypothetical protein